MFINCINTLEEMNYSFKIVSLIPEHRNFIDNIKQIIEYGCNYIICDGKNRVFVDECGIICSTRIEYREVLSYPP